MDSAQWAQGSGMVNSIGERKVVRPNKDKILRCPRCDSTNTKFCYYNNYSLNQPRYLCKTCKRYWTQGGSQRNVPIGGGSRKPKKSNSPQFLLQNPTTQQVQTHFLGIPKIGNNISVNNNQHESCFPSSCSASSADQISALGMNMMMMLGSRDKNPCVQTGGFCFQELKPTLGFGSVDQENGGRVMLSFGHLNKQDSNTSEYGEGVQQNQGQEKFGSCWNGMSKRN